MKVVISCSGKFHAFALAEQMEKKKYLNFFFSTFASNKNFLFKNFVRRVDREKIPIEKIKTNILIAIAIKIFQKEQFLWNEFFDFWVSRKLKKIDDFDVFIGWSGMSLNTIREAKKRGKITIVERGSSHIEYQNSILNEEYARFGISFNIDSRVIAKELKEYQEADFISIPSNFVKRSFLEMGISESKLILNPYGVDLTNFHKIISKSSLPPKLRLVYLGFHSIQKGLIYFINAINNLNIDIEDYEVGFIGSISDELKGIIELNKKSNWIFHGQINQYELKNILGNYDLAIQPSLQEGLSMVIAQLLACGIPVIATTNTGGEDLIENGYNGYIVPIRNSDEIKNKIELLHSNRHLLELLKINAEESVKNGFTWNDYGERWEKEFNLIKSKL